VHGRFDIRMIAQELGNHFFVGNVAFIEDATAGELLPPGDK